MEVIFEYLKALARIEFLFAIILIILLGAIAIALQDCRESKKLAKRLEEDIEWFKNRRNKKK